MTRAKRYEGERIRAEKWHNMSRDKAWEVERAGLRAIEPITRGKFELYCETRYDSVECGYLIVTEVMRRGPQETPGSRVFLPGEIILKHEEPCLEFPSDHLKTKLILLAG